MEKKLINRLLSCLQGTGRQQFVLEKKDGRLGCSLLRIGADKQHFFWNAKFENDLIEYFQILASALPDELYAKRKIKIANRDNVYNCYLSVLPGESDHKKIIMSLEKSQPAPKRLTALGFNSQYLKILQKTLNSRQGLILIAAPDGQGKSVSYYSLLKHLAQTNKSIYSLESYPGQTLDFVSTLKVKNSSEINDYLRQLKKLDPDIIGIDELKNKENLTESLKEAANGRLIIATLGVSGVLEAWKLILESGLKKEEIINGLKLIIGQRIIAKNCPYCLQKIKPDSNWIKKLSARAKSRQPRMMAFGRGCQRCHFQGRSGFLACHELISSPNEINKNPKFRPLLADALLKAENGVFAPEEISKLLI